MTLDVDVVRLSPNHSLGQPSGKKVVVHATRSGVSMNPSEFEGTLNWFSMPVSQVSAHGLIGRDGRIARIVPDSQTAWHAGQHNAEAWGWELEQGVESDGFTLKQMESWAVVARYYVDVFGVAPQHITDISESGFIGHEETPQGIAVGKSDPGSGFMWQAFIAELNAEPEPLPELEPPAEEEEMAKLIKGSGKAVWVYNGLAKRLLKGPDLADERKAWGDVIVLSDDTIASIPNVGTSTGGLTAEETVEASQEAMRRGTG